MTTKSDFAQKLLTDLRVRKERMSAAQNSSRQSSQASRVTRGSSGQTSRGSRQINVLESTSSVTGKTSRRSNGSSRSINTKESSSQIVLYERGQSSKQVRDLSMAIAFAFENSGNLGSSSSNPLVNFFNRFGRRSSNSQKMETGTFYNHNAGGQFPRVSNIHINEISKGVHKLNQILTACSNGLNMDRNSIEIGRELLKGAINLEESLRMLVNLQDAAEYTNSYQKRSRLKLLDEDEDEDDDNEKKAEQWKLDRPRFSFDKTSGNSRTVQGATRQKQLALPYKHAHFEEPISNLKMVPHKRSNSYVQDLNLSAHTNSSSSKSTQEKGRISNVVAKLMGLEELPQKEGSIGKEWKQGKVSRESSKQNEALNRESRNGSDISTNRKLNSTRESKLQFKPEKSQAIPDGSSRMVNSERNQPRKDLKMQTVGMEAEPDLKSAAIVMKKQQNNTNHVNGLKSFEDNARKQTHGEDKQSKGVEREGKTLVLNAELQKRAQNSTVLKAEDRTRNKIDQEVSSNSAEKRNVNNYLARTQQKVQDHHVHLQEQVTKRADHSEIAEQKPQQLQKQNLVAKNHEGQQVNHINAPKSKRSAAMNLQKKLPRDKSVKSNEKAPMKDPPNRRHQDAALIIDDSHKTAANQESSKIDGQSHNSSKTESEPQTVIEKGSSNPPLTEEKPIEVSATQKRAVTRKVQRREIPEKIEVLMSRRNATGNHHTRSSKKPANMLKDLKQQMQIKNRGSKRMEEPSDRKATEGKEVIDAYNVSEKTTEPVKPEEKLATTYDQTIISNSAVADEFENQNIQNMLNLNDNSDSIVSNSRDVLNGLEEQPSALKDEEELKKYDQRTENHEERTELDLPQHGGMQFPAMDRQEQLTEPEKYLKETVIKSQLFLSTAEALFKLNIPLSFLHAGDQENEAGETKLVLDCAYEVMKRKARRHEVRNNPYMKTAISSIRLRTLDDLVRQLCKDLEMLKSYGMNGSDECDVAAGLHRMLNRDIYNENPDVNCMWDFEWSRMMSIVPEMEDVVKDVERHMLNGLLDEITKDLLIITVSV
ncbi:hypothetical protein C2S53_008210 [Perilla frutescens var. hirtella]|uniref:DUF3741 domain-containing protein n=1 Tax=Perilla frutescens var. hirtella TaxID=608512 RepID=A0AAD4J0Q5_PERFH|nr:hypothetical protein C2S53_008210 [Perilla frutescens var. hirtella]